MYCMYQFVFGETLHCTACILSHCIVKCSEMGCVSSITPFLVVFLLLLLHKNMLSASAVC